VAVQIGVLRIVLIGAIEITHVVPSLYQVSFPGQHRIFVYRWIREITSQALHEHVRANSDRRLNLSVANTGKAKPSFLVSHELPLEEAPEAYKYFDNRDKGWTKVVLRPEMANSGTKQSSGHHRGRNDAKAASAKFYCSQQERDLLGTRGKTVFVIDALLSIGMHSELMQRLRSWEKSKVSSSVCK
jgi:hypothetical protein